MKPTPTLEYFSQKGHLKKAGDFGGLPEKAYELALEVFRLHYPHDEPFVELFWDNDRERLAAHEGARAIFRATFHPGGPVVCHKGVSGSAEFFVEIVFFGNDYSAKALGREKTALVRWYGVSDFPRFSGDYEMNGETIVYIS